MKIRKISAFSTKGVSRPLEILTCFGSRVIFERRVILRAYNSVGSKGMNLKFSMLNNFTKDVQKTDIQGNLVFTWSTY